MGLISKVRETKETRVELTFDLRGEFLEETRVQTGIGFFDHMLETLSFHSGMLFELKAEGDLEVDYHHTVEDVGIVLGLALDEALEDRKGICRFGEATIPMDDALSQAVVDLVRRPYFYYSAEFSVSNIGSFDVELIEEFFRAFALNGMFTLHIRNFYGKNSHHIAESLFKAVAHALRRAFLPAEEAIFSVKGSL
jgi:imidazoleglycerol-phosphate dehydratase